MQLKKQITAKEVAKFAGVSQATVSRVMSNKGYVAPETQRKVLEAMETMGFQRVPAQSAGQEDKSILMFTSSLRNHANSYYIDGVESAAANLGYEVLIKHLPGMASITLREMEYSIAHCRAKGVILFTDTIEARIMASLAEHVPTACMLTGVQLPGVMSVDLDEYTLMRKMAAYLLNNGKRKIALINGQTKCRRFAGIQEDYKKVLAEFGLEDDPAWIINVDTNYFSTTAKILAEHLLMGSNPPDAFIAATDIYAAGAICACKKLGLAVPEQVSVIGRDNTAICHVFDPPITAFDVPMEQIGFTVCANLVEQIENPDFVPKNILMDGSLIVRESSRSQ